MYDTLLRRSPKDGQTIIPDLAQRWEISPDGKKYTFHLRKGVKFHDGADFTAEDVKATYDRIAHPPKGVVIPRTPLFATVGDIVVVDPHKIEFRLTEARPKAFMLGAFASGWNIIVRKKTLDDNQGNLRQVMNYPGTGPFKPRLAQGQGSLDPGAQPRLLEQGAAAGRQARDLSHAAVLAGAGLVVPVRARSTTRGCWTRSPGARPRRCRA